MNSARLQAGKKILTTASVLLKVDFLSRVVHLRLLFGGLDVIEHPLPRGLAPARIFEV